MTTHAHEWDLSGERPAYVRLTGPRPVRIPPEPKPDIKSKFRPCGACGRGFLDARRNVKYCGPKCAKSVRYRRHRRWGDKSRAERKQRYRTYGSHTEEQWQAVLKQQGWTCYYCYRELVPSNWTRDHQVPLSRGGSDNIDNIVAACRRCNCRKGTLTASEYFKKLT